MTPEKLTSLSIKESPGLIGTYRGSQSYRQAASSDNTKLAYQADLQHFQRLGGTLPADIEQIEAYLCLCAPHYNPRTLKRRLIALRQWHRCNHDQDPTQHAIIKATMRGIERRHGVPRRQAAPLLPEHIKKLSLYLDSVSGIRAIRDKVMVLLGFYGCLRVSELVGLNWPEVSFVREGVILTLKRSKGDQTGEGAQVAIPIGSPETCPVQALMAWQHVCERVTGPVFCRIAKGGRLLGNEALHPHSWNRNLKQRLKEAKIPEADRMSTHSARRGFATAANRRGVTVADIMQHGRWKSVKTVMDYIEAGRGFSHNAAKALYDF